MGGDMRERGVAARKSREYGAAVDSGALANTSTGPFDP
jgi:hypothetical protein